MTERPNIRRMMMPEKHETERLEFDPDSDLSPSDWELINETVFFNDDVSAIQKLRAALNILNVQRPDLKEGLSVVESDLKSSRKRANWPDFLMQAGTAIMSGHTLKLDITDEEWKAMEKKSHRFSYQVDTACKEAEYLAYMRLVAPERKFSNPDLSYAVAVTEKANSQTPNEYAAACAAIRIAFPEKSTNEYVDWHKLYDGLDFFRKVLNGNSRRTNASFTARIAASMKILAARKVMVTEKGLEIQMREPKEVGLTDREQPHSLEL